jgi:hypothetical protein
MHPSPTQASHPTQRTRSKASIVPANTSRGTPSRCDSSASASASARATVVLRYRKLTSSSTSLSPSSMGAAFASDCGGGGGDGGGGGGAGRRRSFLPMVVVREACLFLRARVCVKREERKCWTSVVVIIEVNIIID